MKQTNIEMLCLYAYPRDESHHKKFWFMIISSLKKKAIILHFSMATRVEDKKLLKVKVFSHA